LIQNAIKDAEFVNEPRKALVAAFNKFDIIAIAIEITIVLEPVLFISFNNCSERTLNSVSLQNQNHYRTELQRLWPQYTAADCMLQMVTSITFKKTNL